MADLDEVAAAIRELAKKRVLIGVPGDAPRGDGAAFSNVSRAYVFEFGSPAINMPPRPHIVPGVEEALPEITRRMEAAAKAVLAGGDPEPHLMAAGQAGVNAVKQKITDKLEPPIKPLSYLSRTTGTLARGYRRRRQARGETGPLIFAQAIDEDVYAQAEAEAASATPLVDTGNYRDSITFVIRDKD
jgi:hypothetical protein